MDGKPSDIRERIRRCTAAGGLSELPPDFGDVEGDWKTINSAEEDPFSILYLDASAANLTPKIVRRHYELLNAFWSKKIALASSGQEYVVVEYCSENATAGALEEYRTRLSRAYEQLATAEGIARVKTRIRERDLELRRQQARQTLGPLMDGLLHDGVFNSDDWNCVAERAAEFRLSLKEIAGLVREKLVATGFQQLGSLASDDAIAAVSTVPWVSPTHRAEARPAAHAHANRTMGGALVLIVIIAMAVAGFAFFIRSGQDVQSLPGNTPAAQSKPVQTTAQSATETTPSKNAEIRPPVTAAPSERSPAKPAEQNDTDTAKDAAAARDAAQTRAEHEQVRTKLQDLEATIATDPNRATNAVAELRQQLAPRAQEFAAEILEISRLQQILTDRRIADEKSRAEEQKRQSNAMAAAEAQRENEEALQQIAALSSEGNYSGAKKLADKLLSKPDLPAPIATRAYELRKAAAVALQNIWSNATAKSKTTRTEKNHDR